MSSPARPAAESPSRGSGRPSHIDDGGSPSATVRIEPYVWRITAVVVLGMMMSILDTTIVNVALHTLRHDLHSAIAQVQWVVTGYLIALAAVIPVTGWAARRYGAKHVYMVSLLLFTAGSAACGLSGSLPELVVFRVLQGVGGGMLMPVVMIIMAEIAGPRRMGKVMAVVAMPMMLAPIFGPVVGGLILQNLHWSWIFFVNVPIGVIAFVLAWRLVPRLDSGEPGKLDLLGLALFPTGAAAIVYGVSQVGSGAAVGSPTALVPVIAGIALVGAFCLHALRAERPLLDIRLYANRVFAGASLTTFFIGAALFGAMILVPLYYQEVRGDSVVTTGLLNGPQGLGALFAMPLANRLTERFGGGRVTVTGVFVLCASSVPLAFVGPSTSVVAISLVLVVRGISIGLCFMPAMTAAYSALRRDQISDATPQINVLQRVGGALGTTVLAVVLQRAGAPARAAAARGAHAHALVLAAHAFDSAYWWGLGIAAIAFIPALALLRAERPAGAVRAASAQAERVAAEAAGA